MPGRDARLFTRTRIFASPAGARGVWRQRHYNDLDIDSRSLRRRGQNAALLSTSALPMSASSWPACSPSTSGARALPLASQRTLEDYEQGAPSTTAAEYRGARHPVAAALSTRPSTLPGGKESLIFLSDRYLQLRKHTLFDL